MFSAIRLTLVVLFSLAACDSTAPATPAAPGPSLPPPVVVVPGYTSAPGCPVTLPGSAGKPPFPGAAFSDGGAYGNSALWVVTYPGGVVAAQPAFVEPDGSIGMKFAWYRIAEGQLSITGRRLDGTAPALKASVPDGYGPSGFQPSGIYFPTEGCWEVTGHVAKASMTFVVYVFKLTS